MARGPDAHISPISPLYLPYISPISPPYLPYMEVLAWPADLTREAEVSALLGAIAARYGRLDLLFNNAGVNVPPTPFGEMGLKEWRHVIDTNLTAAFHVAQQARCRGDIDEI